MRLLLLLLRLSLLIYIAAATNTWLSPLALTISSAFTNLTDMIPFIVHLEITWFSHCELYVRRLTPVMVVQELLVF